MSDSTPSHPLPFDPGDPHIRTMARRLLGGDHVPLRGDTDSLINEALIRLLPTGRARDTDQRRARAFLAMRHHLCDKRRQLQGRPDHQAWSDTLCKTNRETEVELQLDLQRALAELFALPKGGGLYRLLCQLRCEGVGSAQELAQRTGQTPRTVSRKLRYMRCWLEARLRLSEDSSTAL